MSILNLIIIILFITVKELKLLKRSCSKSDKKIGVVRLDLCLVGGLVSDLLAALFAPVDNDIALLGVRERSYWTKYSAAGICSVTGVYVHVQ